VNRRAPFEFARDSFAFANELLWEYQFDAATGKTTFRKREPKPDYALRCFVLARAARQFLYHARFDAGQKVAGDETYRQLIGEVVMRAIRERRANLKDRLSSPALRAARIQPGAEKLLKAGMRRRVALVFFAEPLADGFSDFARTPGAHGGKLFAAVKKNFSPIIHLVKFPSLTINHGMILFDVAETGGGLDFPPTTRTIPKNRRV
jgi:hypothetical protein